MTSFAPAPGKELLEPLADVSAWAAHFRATEIPVLRESADALEALRANEDLTDANSIGEMIAGDPLMTLKLLAYASDHRGQRVVTGAETVIAALVMTGISPFFQAFPPQPAVEDRLASHPEALEGLGRVMRRAHRGADFALGFAVHRTDPNAAAIHAAALLHEFAEMLLWCHAPRLALRIERAQEDDPTLRSRAAQHHVLNVELADLQDALIAMWRLPALLAETRTEVQASNTGARTVALAARLARHTAHGWDNAAVPDDITEVAELLNLSPAAALHLIRDIEPQ
ncbi:MAG: HDOD domain-containing protein [Caldimonas sp.]